MTKVMSNSLRLLILSGLVLAACGTPSPTAPPTSTPPATSQPTSAPTKAAAPTATSAPAAAVDGPEVIIGGFDYSNSIITTYYVEQAVALLDMYGFVIRDLEWELPVESQVLGYLKLDEANQHGDYRLQLPVRPSGQSSDVNHDGSTGEGVQVFAVGYSPNLTGDPFSIGDDRSLGWPTYLASVKTDTENKQEVMGGKLVVWSPDGLQEFPTGFGADGLLFTADDPLAPLPAGYAVVDLDQSPFGLSQESQPAITLYEPKDAEIKDYSALSYTEAFENLFEKASVEWAFNGIADKQVDWPAVHAEVAPLVAEAEKDKDALAFYRAIKAFTNRIPDGHTGMGGGDLGDGDFLAAAGAGYGFSIRELDDGRVLVVHVTGGGPAQAAGMQVGAIVTEFNGQPVAEAIGQVVPYAGPFSLEASRRYQQARYLLRAPEAAEASVTFSNPGAPAITVTLAAISERDSFAFTSIARGTPENVLPVEAKILDSGVGYIQLNSNYDDLALILRLFERALKAFEGNSVDQLILDLRHNGGGAPLGMAGFFTDQVMVLGQQESYSYVADKFEAEGVPDKFYPNEHQYTFDKIAVLVGQNCASACEEEAYGFSQLPNAVVVGFYPSAGVFADVLRGQYQLPEGIGLQFPTERFRLPDGSLFLEGSGVEPDVRVPLTEETLLTADDVELAAAEDAVLGIGPGSLRIEGGPVLLSAKAAGTALNAGAKFLEDLAEEKYGQGAQPGPGETFTYTIDLSSDQRLIWIQGWCASTQPILADNLTNMNFEYSVNGKPVDQEQFAVFDGAAGDNQCHYVYTAAYRWPVGTTTLETRVTMKTDLNDGSADYPAGTSSYLYTVTRP